MPYEIVTSNDPSKSSVTSKPNAPYPTGHLIRFYGTFPLQAGITNEYQVTVSDISARDGVPFKKSEMSIFDSPSPPENDTDIQRFAPVEFKLKRIGGGWMPLHTVELNLVMDSLRPDSQSSGVFKTKGTVFTGDYTPGASGKGYGYQVDVRLREAAQSTQANTVCQTSFLYISHIADQVIVGEYCWGKR